jgi:hypothetical protein
MNIGDEGQLGSRLGAALDLLDPGPLPFDSVVKQGKAVMIRRRVLAAAAVVLAAAVAITAPEAAHYLSRPSPASPARYHVTVNPPGKGADQHLIASGMVSASLNAMRWSVRGLGSGGRFHLHWDVTRWSQYDHGKLLKVGGGSWDGSNGLPGFPANPVSIWQIAYSESDLVAFAVRSDVSYLLVGLSDGQTLALQPVALLGRPHPAVAAIAVPSETAITEISAYSAAGELGYTVPFGLLPSASSRFDFNAEGDFQLVRWFKPGQRALPGITAYTIGHGTARGTAWSERLLVGPWGTCVSSPVGPPDLCLPATGNDLTGTKAVRFLAGDKISQDRVGWDALALKPSVSYVVTREPQGTLVGVKIYSVDGAKFATIAWTGQRQAPLGWIAYSATGARLASGTF